MLKTIAGRMFLPACPANGRTSSWCWAGAVKGGKDGQAVLQFIVEYGKITLQH